MENEKNKGKAKMEEQDDLSSSLPSPSSPSHPPLHASLYSSAEAEPDPELTQESKKLKLEDNAYSSPPPHPSSNPITPLSSIPQSSQRPFYNPHSGKPPLPPQHPSQPQQSTTSAPSDKALKKPFAGYSNPAQFMLNMPEERARARFKLERQRARKDRADWVDPVMVNRPDPSPLRPGPDPFDLVKQVLSEVKEHLNRAIANKNVAKKSNVPPSGTMGCHASSTLVSTSSSSSTSSDSSTEPDTVEEVIKKLEKYVDGIPRTVSAQEMEDMLQEFQVRVDVDAKPTWYALMKKSTMAFWNNLTDYFVCEALESDDSDDDTDDPTSGSGSESSSFRPV